jgi:serine/threonine protein kinase
VSGPGRPTGGRPDAQALAAAQGLAPGATVGGRYRVACVLGAGATGVVVEAADEREGGARVALKAARADVPAAADRVRAEAVALGRLRHPGVVGLRALVVHAGAPVLALEPVRGSDLVSYVRADAAAVDRSGERGWLLGQATQPIGASAYAGCGAAGHARLRAVLPPLAAALEAVHAAGLVHGDVHADHVRVTDEGRVVLLDLGLATPVGARVDGSALPPATHLAPEHGDGAGGGTASPASDWYAVGVLVFQALTGRLPFEGGGREVAIRKQTVPPPSPRFLLGDEEVPPDLERACLALLAAAPSLRADGRALRAVVGPGVPADADAGAVRRDGARG